mgnify:CR=1 FL=1
MHQRLQTKRHPPGIKVCGATSQQLSTTSVLRCPPLRTWKAKNLRRGKVLTGECQMWRGPPSSIAGKAANNHFYVWVCRYPIPVATQMEWIAHVRARETFHIKYQYYSIERIVPSPCTWCSVQSYCHFKRNVSAQHDCIRTCTPSLP